MKIAYQNGAFRGTPKGGHQDCGAVPEAAILPTGYASTAGAIANRRIILAGYRLAGVVKRLFID